MRQDVDAVMTKTEARTVDTFRAVSRAQRSRYASQPE